MNTSKGTKAELISEGLILQVVNWPEKRDQVRWTAGEWKYELRRVRPADLKGPAKLWLEGDWWRLRRYPAVSLDWDERRIKRAAAELKDAIREAGKPLFDETFYRCCEASDDKAFRAFLNKHLGWLKGKWFCH